MKALFPSLLCGLLLLHPAAAETLVLNCESQGDTEYSWNSKYGPYGYTQGGTSLGVGLQFGGPYGNDYTMGILEIPISSLAGRELQTANLFVYSNGFDTGYYYGSAGLRWLDVGAIVPTGDPEADGLGPILGTASIEYQLWSSGTGEGPGWFSFDVKNHVLADLAAGRSFSTFVLNGSRETVGRIRAAEFGEGFNPRIDAEVTPIPEPQAAALLVLSLCLLARRRA
ncbi:MAG: hypothetical protein N2322_06995 [Terrimicrobiaceae bacterium]|nr:hypothetical protein [Terrimicrobiaceae bacterium]